MNTLLVPPEVRDKIGDCGSDGLLTMFAEAHRLGVDSFDRRLSEELSKVRLEIVETRFQMLRWSFLFWLGQIAAVAGMLAFMLRGLR
jgi:hypothetical protein